MDISVIYRQGNMYLLSYKGLDNKRHFAVKRCLKNRKKALEAGDSLGHSNENSKHFSDFQRKLKNREQAGKIGCKQQVDTLKDCFREYSDCDFKQLLKQSCDEGVWGIELEDFLLRGSTCITLFSSRAEGYAFVQQCWLKALLYWHVSGKKVAVRCLEQIFNIEERLRVEGGGEGRVLIEPLYEWKQTLQLDIEASGPVNKSLMKLYVNYDMYLEAQALSEKEGAYSQMIYMDALINKSRNTAYLSFMSPIEMAALLEQVVTCSNQLKDRFNYFSTGHHKWQQVSLCISPLLTAIIDKVNGNMFKNSVTTSELSVLYKKIMTLQTGNYERPVKKKINGLVKIIGALHSKLLNELDLSIFSSVEA